MRAWTLLSVLCVAAAADSKDSFYTTKCYDCQGENKGVCKDTETCKNGIKRVCHSVTNNVCTTSRKRDLVDWEDTSCANWQHDLEEHEDADETMQKYCCYDVETCTPVTTETCTSSACCSYNDDSSTACTPADEAGDWDEEYCYFSAVASDGSPSPSGEGTVKSAKDCTKDTYNTQTNCAAEPGCKWASAKCSNPKHTTKVACEESINIWKDSACGLDADKYFNVCDNERVLRTAVFGTGTGVSGCTAMVANKAYSQSYDSSIYKLQRNLARTACSGTAASTKCTSSNYYDTK